MNGDPLPAGRTGSAGSGDWDPLGLQRRAGSPAELVRAIRGPVTLIVLGSLFALDHLTGLGFRQTWPVLLIVYGLLALFGRESRPAYVPPPPGAPSGPPAGPGNTRLAP